MLGISAIKTSWRGRERIRKKALENASLGGNNEK